MDNIDWNNVRITYAGLAMQGMLEREQGWFGKIISDAMYKELAKHCVSIADSLIEELKKEKT